MKDLYTYEVDSSFGTVSTRVDLDGAVPKILLCPDRSRGDYQVEYLMTPATARRVARALHKAARQVSS